jgi:lipopolysaccharide assembly outer membrane protein LptD (OstA)
MFVGMLVGSSLSAQQQAWQVEALSKEGEASYDLETGRMTGTGGVVVRYGETVLTADTVSVDQATGDTLAEGRVRIQHQGQIWVGERIRYNFFTRQMQSESFRTGAAPLFASGRQLQGDTTNGVYDARSATLTTDDYETPFLVVKARSLRVIPGDRITAKGATVHVGKVPVFYWPYYSRKIGQRQNQFLFLPGYRSAYGPYLYTGYHWYLSDELDLALHTDYRSKRGPGVGPELHFDYGMWGRGNLNYYYAYDRDPGQDAQGEDIDRNRQTFQFDYLGNPGTNFFVKGKFSYESDPVFRKDFFESAFQEDPQPITFGQVRQHWNDITLEAYAQPRLNDFYDTVERLPEVRLNVMPAPVASLPFVYESQNSFGHYERLFTQTNSLPTPDVEGGRLDTFHQVSLPFNLFGWLNVVPRAGGRATYYTETVSNVAATEAGTRGVFNTGVALSTKASRLWPGAHSRTFDIDGLRHILQPQVNYAYVPTPDRLPSELPQYDYALQSFFPLPIDYPDFNSIDAIDAQNVVRLGLRNKLQTRRADGMDHLVAWDVFIDWRLEPQQEQSRFSNLYSDLVLRPRSWLSLRSQFQLDVDFGYFEQALNSITLSPGSRWSIRLSQWYLRESYWGGSAVEEPGNNTFLTRFYYRFNENWGFRMSHRFEETEGRLEEQYYTLYRDLRSFTAALTFRVRSPVGEPEDFSVALTLSLKASPRYELGDDAVQPSRLLGY